MQQTQIIYTASYYEDTTVNKKTPLLYLTVRIIYYAPNENYHIAYGIDHRLLQVTYFIKLTIIFTV